MTSPPAAACCPRWCARPGAPCARWRPVVRGLDAAAVEALVEALPPVGRAEQAAPRDERGTDPQALVDDALAVLTDAAVRDRLARAAVTLAPPGRARGGPAVAAWLRALTAPDARVEAGERGAGASSPTRCASGMPSVRGPPGAGRGELPALRGAHAARPGRSRRRPGRPDRRRHPLDPGVLPPVHRRPEPARARRAGLGRARRPAARRSAGAAARRAGARRPRHARPRARPARGPPGGARPGERRRPPVPHRRRAAARRRRVRGAAAPRVGRLAPGRARALGPQHPGRPACSPAAASAARSWPISAGRWPSATRSSARRSSPSSWRRRRSSCGCAAGG